MDIDKKTRKIFEQGLISLNRVKVKDIIQELNDEWTPSDIVDNLITPVLGDIGDRWEAGEVALSQVYMSSIITEELIDSLLLTKTPIKSHPKMAIVVLDDFHALGKIIVYKALRSAGFVLEDYGLGASVDQLVRRTNDDDVKILLISVLMLPAALKVSELKRSLPNVKIIVGGAPFRLDKQLANEVGADEMGTNAFEAIEIVNRLTSKVK